MLMIIIKGFSAVEGLMIFPIKMAFIAHLFPPPSYDLGRVPGNSHVTVKAVKAPHFFLVKLEFEHIKIFINPLHFCRFRYRDYSLLKGPSDSDLSFCDTFFDSQRFYCLVSENLPLSERTPSLNTDVPITAIVHKVYTLMIITKGFKV